MKKEAIPKAVSLLLLTKRIKSDIMTAEEFDESKVKRDRLGRFAKMSSKDISEAIKEEIGEHKYIQAVNGRVPQDALTSNQWRLWYNEQTQKDKAYLLDKVDERRIVDIDGAFVLTNGSFTEPMVEAVYKNFDLEDQKEVLEVLMEFYGKK